jgi:hypothetical protein
VFGGGEYIFGLGMLAIDCERYGSEFIAGAGPV